MQVESAKGILFLQEELPSQIFIGWPPNLGTVSTSDSVSVAAVAEMAATGKGIHIVQRPNNRLF
jgi:hypothetical protein